jgi:hypothetical protein
MIGGFGVGCDFTWDVDARVKWHASKSVAFLVGYRYLDQDYEKDGGFKWDVVSQGPLAAASLTFQRNERRTRQGARQDGVGLVQRSD